MKKPNVDIYKMNLLEFVKIDKYTGITRVPGGWVYDSAVLDSDDSVIQMTSVFIPFNDEFLQL